MEKQSILSFRKDNMVVNVGIPYWKSCQMAAFIVVQLILQDYSQLEMHLRKIGKIPGIILYL